MSFERLFIPGIPLDVSKWVIESGLNTAQKFLDQRLGQGLSLLLSGVFLARQSTQCQGDLGVI